MAVPVGYEAFRSHRRQAITILCLILASTTVMGIAVYVDSYSIHKWNEFVDTVPFSLVVTSDWTYPRIDDIQEISGVTIAVEVQTRYLQFQVINATDVFFSAKAINPEPKLFEEFPNIWNITEGHMPQNENEIMLEEAFAEFVGLKLGDRLNYTYWTGESYDEIIITVVGFFRVLYTSLDSYDSPYPFYGYSYIWNIWFQAIVHSSLLDVEDGLAERLIYVEVDRSSLSPFNVGASIAYLQEIETKIKELDPFYQEETGHIRFYIDALLRRAVLRYSAWVGTTKISEVVRNSGFMLMLVLLTILAVRYNVNDRRYEIEMLVARGMPRDNINGMIIKEIMKMAIVATFGGIGVGILLSRIGLAATGYLQFDFQRFYSEPFLIALDSLIIAAIVGIVLPFIGIIAYLVIFSTKKRAEKKEGRIARLVQLLKLIRWDALSLIMTGLLMIALYNAGADIRGNSFLAFFSGILLTFAPLVLFIATASLFKKALTRSTTRLSNLLRKILGKLPSAVGVRRAGKSASSAAMVSMIIVLAITLAWADTVVATSLPVTKEAQAKFTFGADIAFNLKNDMQSYWENFTKNVTKLDEVRYATRVSITTMELSYYQESAYFVGVRPLEYLKVGYDYLGTPLNDSETGSLLQTLSLTPNGAIITKTIAEQYNFQEGDILRAFMGGSDVPEVQTFKIIGIVPALVDFQMTDTGWKDSYWRWKGWEYAIWTNQEYLESTLNVTEVFRNKLCVRLQDNVNGTFVAEKALKNGGARIVDLTEPYLCVTSEVTSYLESGTYRFDRSVDVIVTVGSLIAIIATFVVYVSESVRTRKREIALLRAMGATEQKVRTVQAAEMLTLMLTSLFILAIFAPIFITNTLLTISTTVYIYPFLVIISVPWFSIVGVLLLFVGSMLLFIEIVAFLSSKINLAEALNAAWTEAGPLGGEL